MFCTALFIFGICLCFSLFRVIFIIKNIERNVWNLHFSACLCLTLLHVESHWEFRWCCLWIIHIRFSLEHWACPLNGLEVMRWSDMEVMVLFGFWWLCFGVVLYMIHCRDLLATNTYFCWGGVAGISILGAFIGNKYYIPFYLAHGMFATIFYYVGHLSHKYSINK